MVVNSIIADNRFSLRILPKFSAYCKYLHLRERDEKRGGKKNTKILLLDI